MSPSSPPRTCGTAAALVAALIVSAAADASTIVYDNSATGLGAGSIGHLSANGTEPRLDAQEVGDIVTLDPTTSDRILETIRVGYFNSGGTGDDTGFFADFIFRIYDVDGAGEIIDSPIFTEVFDDIRWFDGPFALSFDFDTTPGSQFVLPDTFAYTLALGTRTDDAATDGDGLSSSFSFNSRGPITVGSSPDGLVRRQGPPGGPGTFVTTVFASGRQTRLTITAAPEPTAVLIAGVGVVLTAVRRRR